MGPTSPQVDVLLDKEVPHLSGCELQRVAITMCLGKPADLYLIDEPSAYLASDQRMTAAKVRGSGRITVYWTYRLFYLDKSKVLGSL